MNNEERLYFSPYHITHPTYPLAKLTRRELFKFLTSIDRNAVSFNPLTGERRSFSELESDPLCKQLFPELSIVEVPARRYIVLAGDHYYPEGGFDDDMRTFDTLAELAYWYKGEPVKADWYSCLDTKTGTVLSVQNLIDLL
jgi:hypothetical protein